MLMAPWRRSSSDCPVGFFTVGFGDVVPVGGVARLLALVQAFMGPVTVALVIGYLPTLFNAYSRREAQLLTLDDLTDERTSPTGLIRTWHADGGLDGHLRATIAVLLVPPEFRNHATPLALDDEERAR
jgi:Ion channel